MTPEGDVKRQIRAYLKSLGSRCYSFWPVQMGMGSTTVDCLACIDGRFFSFEVKKPGAMRAVTPRQRSTLKAVTDAKGIAFVTDSLEGVILRVEELGR